MNNTAMISGYSVYLPFAKNSSTFIDKLRLGEKVEKKRWFASESQAKMCGLNKNIYAIRLEHGYGSVFDLVSNQIDRALEMSGLSKECLSGKNVRIVLSGLGPRIDNMDFLSFYDHNDLEDLKVNKSITNLHVANFSQDRLAFNIAKKYSLAFMPTNMHCSSNSSLSAVHYGIQAIESGEVDLVVVINYSEIKTQDISFLHRQSMLEGEMTQPFGEESRSVLPTEGAAVMVLESARHRDARGAPTGIALKSVFIQISAGRSNDASQLAGSLLKVMAQVMAESGISCKDLCAIIPHANGSENSDSAEAQALCALTEGIDLPILAYKGQIGYVTTGSGIVDLSIGHQALVAHELLSPVGTGPLRSNIASKVLIDGKVIKHDKKHLLKVGLGVDGSIIGVVMSSI